MKKNIALLIYSLGSGGAERVLSQWSKLLEDTYNVHFLIYSKDNNIGYEYGGKLICLDVPSNNKNKFTKVFTVLKRSVLLSNYVRKNNIDLVISFCNECNLVNFLAPIRAKKICSIRAHADLDKNNFVKYVIKSNNNTLIVQTDRIKREIIEKYGSKIEKKLIVFGNPFNFARIQSMAKEELPLDLKYLTKYKTICMIGSFKKQKNHCNLLKSYELLRERLDGVKLVLIGADVGLKEIIYKMAQKSKYKRDIVFVGEMKNPYKLLSKCTLFVLPSLYEGIPNALAEAMICGVPVVATDCMTGPRELLSKDNVDLDKRTTNIEYCDYGILVKAFQDEGDFDYTDITEENKYLTNAMFNILSNNVLYSEYKKKVIMGSKRFNLYQYKNELIDIIESVIAE